MYSSSFPDRIMTLCARFNGIPKSSVNKDLLLQPPFEGLLAPVYESRRAAALSTISAYPNDPPLVDRTLKGLRSFTKQIGMYMEFAVFAAEVANFCPYNVKRMIEKRYI